MLNELRDNNLKMENDVEFQEFMEFAREFFEDQENVTLEDVLGLMEFYLG